ncbi:hypothetical protein IQ238_29725 [Pleurocapsales cyanobacterium LEGE 06147]|nr:hypothetical protein [Pleurocapsales cyanobacterium LEGE 06147]
MPTDYILFVHGVKTSNREGFERLANTLLDGIQQSVNDNTRVFKPIYFFWGDLGIPLLDRLKKHLAQSSKWPDFWFQDFRTKEILEFVGDAALYLSRHIGSQIVRRFKDEALGMLEGAERGDRLHFVTHSLGSVILFDLLFAGRWEDPQLDRDESTNDIREMVKEIRQTFFGLGNNPSFGLPLASIHTMGSPIALFSLLSINSESTHDLTPQMKTFLRSLYELRQQKLTWRNFAHPGDPIAYPLEGVIPMLLDEAAQFAEIQDVIIDSGNIFLRPFQQRLLPLIWGGEAHGSYWENKLVAQTIGQGISTSPGI